MLEHIIRFSIDRRWLVVLGTLGGAALGAYALLQLPIDAVPDITNRQVQVNAAAPSLSPTEVEKQVTFPLETALAGIPGLEYTRSFSRNGFAQITAVFGDDVDVYFARQQVAERLVVAKARLPRDTETVMGPISTGLGEIYIWTVEYAHPHGMGAAVRPGEPGWQKDGSYLTPEGERLRTDQELAGYLRTVQDWIIRPQLKGVPGVAEIDANGGYVKQYHVVPNLRALTAYGLSFHDLLTALERNNLTTGAGFVEHNGEMYVVRAAGRVSSAAEIATLPITERAGVALRIGDVAQVVLGSAPRTGSASENGEEVVLGTALMLLGANSRTVAAAVGARLDALQSSLPADIRALPVLDRSDLVNATIRTVLTNLAEGALLVVIVLFLMLGNFRAALITALAIPLSMLLTAIGMVQTKTSGNLMSLGAIDFGLIVDGAVIIVENCLRHLAETQRRLGRVLTTSERLSAVFAATKEVRGATVFGEAIIVTVYIPILSLTGVEGKMFHPMALTVIFALGAAFVLSLTFVPAMVALLVRGVREEDNRVVRYARAAYEPALRWALRWKGTVLSIAVALFGGALLLFTRLGQEFVPTLSELDIVVMATRIPSTSLSESTAMQLALEKQLQATIPEAQLVFSRTGTADTAIDPMPPYLSDTFIILKPRSAWSNPEETKDDVRERIEEVVSRVPGNAYEFTQPIEMRFNELLAGVRGDLAVKVFGDEFDVILPVARRVARVLGSVPGAADLRVEEVEGAPVLNIDVRREELARYGLSVADVHEAAAIAIGGRAAGQLYQGDRRFDVVVRLGDELRQDRAALEALPILLSHEDAPTDRVALAADDVRRFNPRVLPLGAVATLAVSEGPNQISREDGKRRIVVQVNVRGRDIGSFVAEAEERIGREVTLPAGVWLRWGGQYENLVSARKRLALVVPVCFLVILLLLYSTFANVRPALMVFTGVPLALVGGIASLWLRDMPFSISAAVGFIALSGVAVLNGLVMVTFINQLRATDLPIDDAIVRGAVGRVRPVLMTALVASLGFVPMAFATGTGAEVQRPLATVVIGGLVSSTALTLFVLPVLYRVFNREQHQRIVEPE